MVNNIYRWLLVKCFNRIYPDLNAFIDEVNAETWICAQHQTGGHALSVLKPIGEVEAVSIRCCLSGNLSIKRGVIKTEDIDYYSKSWKP